MSAFLLLLQHAHGDEGTELAYFWASILTILLPIGAFVALAVLTVRGYLRRTQPDGGGEPPMRNAEFGMRNGASDVPSGNRGPTP
jgi:hypothetical protein